MKFPFLCLAFSLLIFSAAGCKKAAGTDAKPENLNYLNTPSGSCLAYVHIPTLVNKKSTPIFFLHGGPGASQLPNFELGRKWYKHLASLGFDVYVYDQSGCGYSKRLAEPAGYTVERHVDDLEAMRKAAKADSIIIIGDSWGASLGSNYIAKYPERVERAVFTSPGFIDIGKWNIKSSTPRLAPEFLQWVKIKYGAEKRLHYQKLDSLLQTDLAAAYKLYSDAEMDSIGAMFLDDVIMPNTVYNKNLLDQADLNTGGLGWWAMTMTIWNATNHKPPVKDKLRSIDIPVLILRGEYDYLPDAAASEYRDVFKNAKYVPVASAGHLIWLEKPGIYKNEIEKFLAPGN